MYRPLPPRSTAAREAGWGSAEAAAFSQFAAARVEAVGEMDESQAQRRRNPEDVLIDEQFVGEEAYTGTIDSGYYIDLLYGSEQSQDLSPTTEPPIHNGRATGKSSQGRSKNFRDEEDLLLVSAWLNVGMDAIQGVDQTQGTFWKRIHDYFHTNKTFNSNRSVSSLMNPWCSIHHDVNLFCGYLSKIEDRNHSGWTFDDKVANACAMFKKVDPKERKFAFIHCWRVLKDKPKWLERRKEIGCAKRQAIRSKRQWQILLLPQLQ